MEVLPQVPQLKNKNIKLLLLSSSVFLLEEIERACVRLGIACRHLALESEEMDGQQFVHLLVREIRDFKPDALLTLNHSGVDREGILFDLLEKMQVPLISWFVDNPHLLLSFYSGKTANAASSWLNIFTWDKDNINSLKAEGFTSTYYLPLGTDATRFHPKNKKIATLSKDWQADISFVGTSMYHKVGGRLLKSGFPQEHLQEFLDLGADFTLTNERSIAKFIETQTNKKYAKLLDFYHTLPEKEAKYAFQAALTWEATRVYRLACVKKILDFNPLIVGDDGWQHLFSDEKRPWRLHDNINYYHGAHLFYTQSIINFNSTSMQMKGASNQRILDVPASGSFVLTDYREQMEDMFELSGKNQEMVCYHSLEEIPELVRFYLQNENAREKIIQAGRKRVLACHTWDHRVAEVVNIIQEKYGVAKNNMYTTHEGKNSKTHASMEELERKQRAPDSQDPQNRQTLKEEQCRQIPQSRQVAQMPQALQDNADNADNADFWVKVRKKRFQGNQGEAKLLFIDTNHFLLGELARACRRIGVKYKYLRLTDPTKGDATFIEQLLKEALTFAPDAVFTINSFGLDPEGRLLTLLEKMEIPLISWFVDNPENILWGHDALISPWTNLFSFDKDTIPLLKAQGFDTVHYLPLATDSSYFLPLSQQSARTPSLPQSIVDALLYSANKNKGKSLVFVGDTVSSEAEKRFEHSQLAPSFYNVYRELGEAFVTSDERSIQIFFQKIMDRNATPLTNICESDMLAKASINIDNLNALGNTLATLSKEAQRMFFAGITAVASQTYRASCVKKLLDFSPLIVGDGAWENILGTQKKWILHPQVPYRHGLSKLYAQATINFNCTSMQMKGAPNQRIFDVSACGVFILSDYREQMAELFELEGANMQLVTYKNIEEIPDLIDFYMSHDTEREKIARRARERVLAEHTWDKRLLEMISIMRDKYGK